MKKIAISILSLFLFFNPCEAQLFGNLSKRLEEKVNVKANEVINRAGGRIENRIEGKINNAIDKKMNALMKEKGIDINDPNMSESDAMKKMMGDKKADDSYTFYSYMRIRFSVIMPKEKDNTIITQRFDYGASSDLFSMSEMKYIKGAKKVKNESSRKDRIVYDHKNNAMFTFLSMEDQKMQMGVNLDVEKLSELEDENHNEEEIFTITKTGKSQTIAGYNTSEYLCVSSKSRLNVWMTNSGVSPFPEKISMFHSTPKDTKKKKTSFVDHPTIKKKVLAGCLPLMVQRKDLETNVSYEMKIYEFGKETTVFDTRPYASLMDEIKKQSNQ